MSPYPWPVERLLPSNGALQINPEHKVVQVRLLTARVGDLIRSPLGIGPEVSPESLEVVPEGRNRGHATTIQLKYNASRQKFSNLWAKQICSVCTDSN